MGGLVAAAGAVAGLGWEGVGCDILCSIAGWRFAEMYLRSDFSDNTKYCVVNVWRGVGMVGDRAKRPNATWHLAPSKPVRISISVSPYKLYKRSE